MTEKINNQPEILPPEAFNYGLLRGHMRTNGTMKTGEQLRMEYIELTDNLVHKMTHGVEVADRETGERSIQKPDVVVWLDKSARPLAWLTKELWPKLAPEPGSDEVPEMPAFKFVNIDREQWITSIDEDGEGLIDINSVDRNIIRSLRSIFVDNRYKQKGLTEEVDKAPSELDNKTILIVDEVRSTGRTLNAARDFFVRAFPTSNVATSYWMSGLVMKGTAIGNADLPVWYHEKDEYGRGVANRQEYRSRQSENLTQRLGAWFLSRRFEQPDQKALKLRKEFRELATNPDVPILPHVSRGREERKKRMEALNGKPLEEVVRDVRTVRGIK